MFFVYVFFNKRLFNDDKSDIFIYTVDFGIKLKFYYLTCKIV